MPAYITADEVRGLGRPQGDTDPDSLMDLVIGSNLRKIDRFAGQFWASGGTTTYDVKGIEIKDDGSRLTIPRFSTIDTIETKTYVGGRWETIESDDWEGYLFYPERWTGIDTVDLAYCVQGRVRITGNLGWGTPDFDTDPVIEDVKLEALKQCRYDHSRLAIGGGGNTIHGGDIAVNIDHFDFVMSLRQLLRGLKDTRRMIG